MQRLPVAARVYVAAVIAAAASVFVVKGTPEVPDVWVFVGLLVVSALASGFRVNLPLGTTASNLSISYTCDFAALLLLGGPLTTIVAGASAWAQSAFPLKRSNPPVQIAFNVAARSEERRVGKESRRPTLRLPDNLTNVTARTY